MPLGIPLLHLPAGYSYFPDFFVRFAQLQFNRNLDSLTWVSAPTFVVSWGLGFVFSLGIFFMGFSLERREFELPSAPALFMHKKRNLGWKNPEIKCVHT